MREAKINLFYWIFAKKGTLLDAVYAGARIKIRKGTTDLRVARASRNEFAILKFALPKNFSGVIIDAGGYIGTAAIAFSNQYPNAKIVSIEASKENFTLLQMNCKDFKNIIPLNNALSSESNVSIYLNDPGIGNWGFTTIQEPFNNIAKKKYKVDTITIDAIQDQFGEIGLLKLDIEGAEKDLFELDRTIHSINIIMVELHERFIPGCDNAFFNFSKNRIVLKDSGEKYISVKHTSTPIG